MYSWWSSCKRGMQSHDIESIIDYLYNYMGSDAVEGRPSKPEVKDEWHFENGTIVIGPCTLSESRQKMVETAKQMRTFYASQLLEGLYEVQFTDDLHPDVVVIVEADSGLEAGRLARRLLATDYAYHHVIEP